jgi:hypothetical protein
MALSRSKQQTLLERLKDTAGPNKPPSSQAISLLKIDLYSVALFVSETTQVLRGWIKTVIAVFQPANHHDPEHVSLGLPTDLEDMMGEAYKTIDSKCQQMLSSM